MRGRRVQSGETPLMLAAKDCETEVVAALEDALKIEEMRKEAGASALFFPPHTQTPPSRSGGRVGACTAATYVYVGTVWLLSHGAQRGCVNIRGWDGNDIASSPEP